LYQARKKGVHDLKSFISYIGGKSLLAGRIIPMMPEHKCYCEVFAGASWVLFKKEPSDVEIINDINSDLVTLYRVVKHHLDEFAKYFRWALVVAREEFERLKAENPDTLTDIQRAARFYYLLRNGFSNRVPNPSFGIAATREPRLNLLRIEEELSAAHLRLARVYIENMHYEDLIRRFDKPHTFFYVDENMHYEDLIRRFDKPHTFFYVDPPYYGCENYYGESIFKRKDFGKLRDVLKCIKGKFMMSINDAKEIKELYRGFHVRKVETTYTASGADKKKRVAELLIMNYRPKAGKV
jgi:DNA adenine methylase